MNAPLFDDSLMVLVDTLVGLAGQEFVEAGTALRDASGRLTFVADRPPRDEAERESLVQALQRSLGAYARAGRPIIFRGDAGSEPILAAPDRLPIQVSTVFCRLLDRRIVGSGWLDAPATNHPTPPRVVFATLKGGVGRSTALTIAAADFARRGRNVLVIDLDLEAPGLGNLLLDEEGTSDLGVIDYLVENGIGGINEADLHLFIASSKLTDASGGRVDVMPAIGRRSIHNPENVLSKLSRAMIEDVFEGKTVSVAEQISAMITRITDRQQYDVVFIDSRAGLAELAAPAVLGLGATVLLFGTAQKQTIEGYRALFAALQLLAQRDRDQERDAEWRTKLRPVYAKAGFNPDTANHFLEDMYEIYSDHIYDAEETTKLDGDLLRFARDDNSAPHWPLTIPFSQNFVDFDPGRVPGQLTQAFYEQAFRPFITELDAAIASGETSGGPQP